MRYGGKGANQALAASRAGGSVCLIGCIGNDNDGRDYQNYLLESGIDIAAIRRIPENDTPTGSAFIAVDASGENTINPSIQAPITALRPSLSNLTTSQNRSSTPPT